LELEARVGIVRGGLPSAYVRRFPARVARIVKAVLTLILELEARVGIEPAYTELQSAA
jgi:hypothetical protein